MIDRSMYHMNCEVDPSSMEEERERKKVEELMRALAINNNNNAKEDDEDDDHMSTLRRFLRARDMNIEKASEMYLKHQKWRASEVPKGFISKSEIRNELDQKKFFTQGFDKNGHPIGVILGGRHRYSYRNINEFKRMCVYCLDKICSRMQSDKDQKFTIITDLKGWCYGDCDIRAYHAALEIMQNHYPERLNKAFLIHVPYPFKMVWKLIYPFIDMHTKNKFIFVDDRNIKETLLRDIEENHMPDIYGGKLPLLSVEEA